MRLSAVRNVGPSVSGLGSGTGNAVQLAQQRVAIDVVHEGSLSINLNHWKPLPVLGFELGVTTDVHLLELERDLGPDGLDHAPRTLAEVTAFRVVEPDFGRHTSGFAF